METSLLVLVASADFLLNAFLNIPAKPFKTQLRGFLSRLLAG